MFFYIVLFTILAIVFGGVLMVALKPLPPKTPEELVKEKIQELKSKHSETGRLLRANNTSLLQLGRLIKKEEEDIRYHEHLAKESLNNAKDREAKQAFVLMESAKKRLEYYEKQQEEIQAAELKTTKAMSQIQFEMDRLKFELQNKNIRSGAVDAQTFINNLESDSLLKEMEIGLKAAERVNSMEDEFKNKEAETWANDESFEKWKTQQ